MSKKIYTIFDKVARKGNNLFVANTQEEAKRIFETSMARFKSENPYFNPSDYTCFFLGTYFDEDVLKEGPDGRDRIISSAPFILGGEDSVDLYDVPLDVELPEDE